MRTRRTAPVASTGNDAAARPGAQPAGPRQRVSSSAAARSGVASKGAERVSVSEASLDDRATLMTPGHDQGPRRGHEALRAPRVKPRKARRQNHRNAMVEMAVRVQLGARIRVKHAAPWAGWAAVGAVHVAVPRGLTHVPASAGVARHVRVHHRGVVRDRHRPLGRGVPDRQDRRNGGDDDGCDDGSDGAHETDLPELVVQASLADAGCFDPPRPTG
jgi:hypothetical protein